MRIRLDHGTPVPPFEQIRAQIALHVAAGRLIPGDRLPAIRSLADELDVSTNTIARAYRELITADIAEAAGRRGTRITAAPPVAHDVAQRSEEIEAAADRFALAAQEWNVATDEALEAVIIALRRTSNERSR
ncbi:MAG: GntR family transcriptional regulator [Acidimicrobiales bacterium]|jgi:GntR family transcriptional regulator